MHAYSRVKFSRSVSTAKLFYQRNFPDLRYITELASHCLHVEQNSRKMPSKLNLKTRRLVSFPGHSQFYLADVEKINFSPQLR